MNIEETWPMMNWGMVLKEENLGIEDLQLFSWLLHDFSISLPWLFHDSSLILPWLFLHSSTFMTDSWHIHDTFMTHSWHRERERARETHNSDLKTDKDTTKWHTGLLAGAKNWPLYLTAAVPKSHDVSKLIILDQSEASVIDHSGA